MGETNIMSFAFSEDSYQPGYRPSLNRVLVFAGRTDHFVGFCHEMAPVINQQEKEGLPSFRSRITIYSMLAALLMYLCVCVLLLLFSVFGQ